MMVIKDNSNINKNVKLFSVVKHNNMIIKMKK